MQGEKSRGIWIAADVTFQTSWPAKVSIRTKKNQKIHNKRWKCIFIFSTAQSASTKPAFKPFECAVNDNNPLSNQ